MMPPCKISEYPPVHEPLIVDTSCSHLPFSLCQFCASGGGQVRGTEAKILA